MVGYRAYAPLAPGARNNQQAASAVPQKELAERALGTRDLQAGARGLAAQIDQSNTPEIDWNWDERSHEGNLGDQPHDTAEQLPAHAVLSMHTTL